MEAASDVRFGASVELNGYEGRGGQGDRRTEDKETEDRGQETEDRRQGTGDRGQGDRGQGDRRTEDKETEDRGQRTGDRGQETGDKGTGDKGTRDRGQETGNRGATLAYSSALAAINWEHHSGDKLRFVRSKKQRRISHIPGRSHLATKRNRSISLADQVLLRDSPRL